MRALSTLFVVLVISGLILVSVRTIHSLRLERLAAESCQIKREVSKVDFYFEEMNFRRYNSQGHLTQQLEAKKAVHFEDDNHFTLDYPIFTFYHFKEKPWVITADKGVSRRGRELVDLRQKVVVQRERGEFNSKVRVETEQLNVDTLKRMADTDLAVSFLEDANFMRGVGASIDFNEGAIKLASRIQLWYKLNF